MSVIILATGDVFGPYKLIETLSDRLHADNCDLPFTVIGTDYQISEDDALAPLPPEVKPTPPESVSMRQARLQLLALNSLAAINTAISTMPEVAQIEWEYATEVSRANPLVPAMAGLLGWSESDTDMYFTEAAKL